MQAHVAGAARSAWGDGDVFDEAEPLRELAEALHSRGYQPEAVRSAVDAMTAFPTAARAGEHRWAAGPKGGDAERDQAGTRARVSAGSGGDAAVMVETMARGAQADSSSSVVDAYSSGRRPSTVQGYVVSISGKHGFRRLHKLGACFRVPGIDYMLFEEMGPDMPDHDKYDEFCGNCWPPSGDSVPRSRQDRAVVNDEAEEPLQC